MDSVRVGIIGIGNIGSAHAHCIANSMVENLRLCALCDTDAQRGKVLKKEFPDIPFFTNYSELLQSGLVDALIISTPHKSHVDIAEEALSAGFHVLVEKPVDITVTKAERINRIAEKSDKVFAIMFNQRTNPLFARAREIVQGGKLGALKRSVWLITNWYRSQHYYDSGDWRATWVGEGGGVLLNQAPHNLDIWQWICGMPSEITASCEVSKYHNIEVEDDVTILAKYENGATGVFIASTGEYPGTNRLEISGELGKLVLEDGILKWWSLKQNEREVCFSSPSSSPKIETEYTEMRQESPEASHRGILQNFTNAILFGEELVSPGTDGINELMISNAAYLSSFNGSVPVKLPVDGLKFNALLEKLSEHSTIKEKKHSDAGSTTYSQRWKVKW